MTSNLKSAAAHNELPRLANSYRVAIVGASTLKGKEVAEVLHDRNFPSADVKLLDDDESLGQLETMKDEVTFIQSVRAEQFERLDFTFFASDPACTLENWRLAQKAGSAILDLSFALEDQPGAAIRSPWVERQRGQSLPLELQPGPVVPAHPAAVVLALLLLRLQKAGAIRRAVATVFQPASEQGQKGMDELHEQTVNLLSFQQLPKKVFDTQVAFNLVARYGAQAPRSLAGEQQRVLRHYRVVAGEDAPVPALLLLQAPVFHGHALALHLDMAETAEAGALARALAGEHVAIAEGGEDAPSNVSAAGQGDILVSLLPGEDGSFWLWAVSDNLRVAATNAVECAEAIAAVRPRGKIQ